MRLVDGLYEQLMVDPQWSVRDARGFDEAFARAAAVVRRPSIVRW